MGYKVAVIGATGNVGTEILNILAERSFPVSDIVALASERSLGREVSFGGDPTLKVRALASVDFTGPWDRHAIENARPQITRIKLDEFDATWGELGLKAVGTVDVDERGLPTGEVAIKAKNWRKMIEIAEASGAIAPELVSTVTGALQFVAGLSGNSKTLDVTLRLSGGAVFLGPIPIGAAPIIKIR